MRSLVAILSLFCVGGLCAAPPDVPTTIVADPGQLVPVTVKVPVDKDGNPTAKINHFRNFKDGDAFWAELVTPSKGERKFVYQAPPKPPKSAGVRSPDGAVTLTHVVAFSAAGDVDTGSMTTITVTYPAPPPPPAPPAPVPPKPADPDVSPVTSFHVILVYESGDTLTAAQRAVVYGQTVEDWLTANCTGGKAGWRRRDKDAPGDADPTMAALWAAVQPKVTTTPCVAMERNTKVEIVPLEATPAAMVTVLQAYRGK